MKPLVAAAVHSCAGLKTSRRPQVRLLGTAPGTLLLSTRGAVGRLAMVGISGLPRRIAAALVLCALAAPFVGVAPSVASSPISSSVHVRALCPAPTPGTAECLALVRTDVPAGPASAVSPMTAVAGSVKPADTMTAFNPTGIQSAYALPSSSAGAGLTVAIVDAYDSPDAESFMGTYRSQFGLPACTTANGCFRKVDQNGGTTYPTYDPGWEGEISLDLDMVSAACPKCHILLVEADTSSTLDLATGVNTAVSLGAVAVSNSYGGPEQSNEATAYDPYYNHPGVAITASSGDCGYDCAPLSPSGYQTGVEYPAASRNVVAVGGTSLTQDTSARGWSESAWGNGPGSDSGAGSGCSAYESKPSWQHDTGCTKRMAADVSAVADPYTPVWSYDSNDSTCIWSLDGVHSGWCPMGGTSASSPIIASTFALAGRPAAGTYPASYLYGRKTSLNDAASGTNDVWGSQTPCPHTYFCNGVAGYDGPTGLGTPNGVGAFKALPATHLSVGTFNPYPAGVSHSVTVTARDLYGNVATGYRGTIHFTSSDTHATLPADYTFTSADKGAHTFTGGLTLKTAGSQWVRATDKTTASITGAQTVTVTPGAATHLTVGTFNPYPAGVTHSVTVKALDAYGNTATGYLGTIHFTSSDTKATLPADYTFTSADKGVHTFTGGLVLKTAGSEWVRATDKTTASITGAQTVTVTPGSAKTLSVGTFNPYPAGVTHSVTVKALDAYGNTATGYLGTIHFTSSDTKATLPADYTFTSADKGVHTFTGGLVLKTAGSEWVRATDKTTASITGTQTVTVT